jgi:protein-arginine kinase activator protein McsA
VDNLFIEKEILESKISKVLIDLEEDMIKCVENEDYEKAAILRDKINKLK